MEDLITKAKECIDKYNRAFNKSIPYPTVNLNIKGIKILGRANHCTFSISINPGYYREYRDYAVGDIIPHEVAHLINGVEHPNTKPHGPEWKKFVLF